ncbi:MAG: CbbQ/NirQ/NorQ C-terminal domain-containing protein, partial [Deltaproteobacteria bacterium]|nr:CbbQ/NirQ/NorQ C-terminal domain-containing protein [Deltaproteobacteria bacterium]
NAGKLIQAGISPHDACLAAVAHTLSDDIEMQRSMDEMISSLF